MSWLVRPLWGRPDQPRSLRCLPWPDASDPALILTERGAGYVLAAPVERLPPAA